VSVDAKAWEAVARQQAREMKLLRRDLDEAVRVFRAVERLHRHNNGECDGCFAGWPCPTRELLPRRFVRSSWVGRW